MKNSLILFLFLSIIIFISCSISQKEVHAQQIKTNNLKSNSNNTLSESDMNNPSLLASEGWKIVGYSTWGWQLKDQRTINRLNQAESLFNRAIKLDQGNADAIAGLAKLNLIRGYIPGSVINYNRKYCEDSLDLIKKSDLINTDIFNMIYIRSEIQLCLNNYVESIREAEKIADIANGCLPHFMKSRAYFEKYRNKKDANDKNNAIFEGTDYLECSQNKNQDSINDIAYINLWSILAFSKDYDSTIEYFKNNFDSKPYSSWSYRNYVWVLLQRGTLEDLNNAEVAISKAKKALNLEIDAMQLYGSRGRLYLHQKKYDKAQNDFSKLLSINVLSVSNKDLSEVCSQLDDKRCAEIWQKRIKKYIEFKQCKNAKEEFDLQYKLYPQAFEALKKDVQSCTSSK